jgi:hypothetical protein
MSDEITRNTRSIRFKKDYCKIRKQLKIAKAYLVPVTEKQIHRLAKSKVLNCGDPNCVMCGNPRKMRQGKTSEVLTIQERSNNEKFSNDLEDFFVSTKETS